MSKRENEKDKRIITYFKLSEEQRREIYMKSSGLGNINGKGFAPGGSHVVFIKDNGTAAAVGENNYGQCDVDSWERLVKVAAGSNHTVGLKSDGSVYAVGDNSRGQCDIADWLDIVDVFAEKNYTVGVTKNGDILTTRISASDEFSCVPIEDGKVEIIRYYGSSEDVVVPAAIDDADVAVIGKDAFYKCDFIKKISLPESIESIGNSAFYGCKKLRRINIPEGVKEIGVMAFADCCNLRNVVVCEANLGELSANTGLVPSEEPKRTYALDDVKYSLYSSVDFIEVRNRDSGIKQQLFGNIDEGTFYAPAYIKIPDGVKVIENEAFADCSGIVSIVIPDSVKKIGKGAFKNCDSLTSITIPESVTSIGTGAFSGCIRLTEIILPKHLNRIASETFYGYKSLNHVKIYPGVVSIGSNAFRYCSDLKEIFIPESVMTVAYGAFDADTRLLYT